MIDTTAACIVSRSMRVLHRAGGTAFELFQKTVYLIFNTGRRASHLFARHSSVNVNVLEIEMELISWSCSVQLPRRFRSKGFATFYGVKLFAPKLEEL